MVYILDDRAERTRVGTPAKISPAGVAGDRKGMKKAARIILTGVALCCSALSNAALADSAGRQTTNTGAGQPTNALAISTRAPSVASQEITTPGAARGAVADVSSTSKANDLASRVGSYGDLSADAPCH